MPSRWRSGACHVGDYLLLGRGEQSTGAGRVSIPADAMEAVIGAVYLSPVSEGAARSSSTGSQAHRDRLPLLGAGLDWKTSLQELCAAIGHGTPEYVVAGEA